MKSHKRSEDTKQVMFKFTRKQKKKKIFRPAETLNKKTLKQRTSTKPEIKLEKKYFQV